MMRLNAVLALLPALPSPHPVLLAQDASQPLYKDSDQPVVLRVE
ncbi:MAG TPA: hypothetical protein VLU25_20385 [Acidobacteriota bacterium]|nr:hypothetical protein [Acidobacteriota bacterium]